MDRRDGRLGAVPESHRGAEIQLKDLAPGVGPLRAALHLLLQVEARREPLAGSADHHGPNLWIGFGRVQASSELEQNLFRQSVQPLGPIQLDVQAVRVARDVQELESVAHICFHSLACSKAYAAL